MIENHSSLLVLSGSVILASFLGSWHCAMMCGPVACFVAQKKQLWQYQLGRFISYVSAGALSGYIANQFLASHRTELKYLAVIILIGLLVHMFFSDQLVKRSPKWVSQIYFKYRTSGFLLGLFSVFLPCAWLYTFVVSAGATGSAFGGAFIMFLFWGSTIPSLTVAQVFLKKVISESSQKRQKISNLILLAASVYSLASFLMH